MRSMVATFVVGLGIAIVAYAATRSDLDMNGFDILRVNEITFTNGSGISANLPGNGLGIVPAGDTAIVMQSVNGYVRIHTGNADPTLVGVDSNPGGLYLRNYMDGYVNRGAVYVKTGPLATDWTRIAP